MKLIVSLWTERTRSRNVWQKQKKNSFESFSSMKRKVFFCFGTWQSIKKRLETSYGMRNKHDFSLSGQISFDLDFLLCRRERENSFSVLGHRDHTKLLDIKYNEIYLPQKSIRFIKIGFMGFFFFLFDFWIKSFSHENGKNFPLLSEKKEISFHNVLVCRFKVLRISFGTQKRQRRRRNVQSQNGLAQGKIVKFEGWVCVSWWGHLMSSYASSICFDIYSYRKED